MTIERELQTNLIKFDFDLALSIRKIRERGELRYQVLLKNNKNGNELPIKEVKIPAQLKLITKKVVKDYTYATLKKMIDTEQDKFNMSLEQFLEENLRNRTKKKTKNT